MAIFSKKPEDLKNPVEATDNNTEVVDTATADMTVVTVANGVLIVPRLSEKGTRLKQLNKFVFKIEGKINKVELRKAIEKTYGAKVTGINMITVKGKSRRRGRIVGQTSSFKKAVVTLAPDSKKIETIEV